jgi:hypothetical protein
MNRHPPSVSQKMQVYDFPHPSSHCAVIKPFGQGHNGESPNFVPPSNSILLDNKTQSPTSFSATSCGVILLC